MRRQFNDEYFSLYKLANFNYTHVSVLAATARPGPIRQARVGPDYCQTEREQPMLTLDKIYHAKFVLKQVARKTDLIAATRLCPGTDLYLKTENLLVTGSFKVRGAYYKISQLSGIQTTLLMPMRVAASATPCAWLPAEQAMTPFARSSADSWLIL